MPLLHLREKDHKAGPWWRLRVLGGHEWVWWHVAVLGVMKGAQSHQWGPGDPRAEVVALLPSARWSPGAAPGPLWSPRRLLVM